MTDSPPPIVEPRSNAELLRLALVQDNASFKRSINFKFTVLTVMIIIGLGSNMYRSFSGGEKLAVIQKELLLCKQEGGTN